MELYVDKDVDLMRSTFIAVGIADLLYKIPPRNMAHQLVIKDMGSCYVIVSSLSPDDFDDHIIKSGYLKPLLPAIRKPHSAGEKKLIKGGTPAEEVNLKYIPRDFKGDKIDYGREKEISDNARKTKRKKNDTREEGDVPQAKPDFPVWAHLCSYFGKGSAMRVGYPSLIHTWHAHQGELALKLWQLILQCYGQSPNAVDEVRAIWNKEFRTALAYEDFKLTSDLSSLAIVSPSTSKGLSDLAGYNSLSEGTPNTFWLELYFAFAGFMKVAMPYNIGSDVTTFYPLPHDIELNSLYDIMEIYRKADKTTSLYRFSNQMNRAKLDVLNQILYYRHMIQHFIHSVDDGSMPDGYPMDAISGIIGFYYKDISTQIPFDETLFAQPAWMSHNSTYEDLELAEQILDEHYKLVSAIRGKPPKYQLTADELHILSLYRRYVTHGEQMDWIKFAIAYGLYRFQVLTEIRGFPALSLSILKESLPMNDKQDFSGILESPGFQKVSKAINYCTVYARYKKDVQRDGKFPFKVQHGLGADLLRNAHDPARFLSDLSKFIYDYHQESISVQVDTDMRRISVESEDLHAITELVAQYGSNIVAHLLVAAGYASHFNSNQSNQ